MLQYFISLFVTNIILNYVKTKQNSLDHLKQVIFLPYTHFLKQDRCFYDLYIESTFKKSFIEQFKKQNIYHSQCYRKTFNPISHGV